MTPRTLLPRARLTRLALVGAVALVAALLACGPNLVRSRDEPRRNVLLVSIDTLRADHVGAYGAEFAETPTLDALAREGVRFATAMAPTPLTLPSHASLHTGLLPPRHGVRHNGLFHLPDDIPTLATRFRAAGYATGAVVGAIVLDSRFGLDRGFDVYDDAMSGRQSAAGGISGRQSAASGFPERSADAVSEAALGFLAARDDEPFFLWLHYYDPHASYRAPAPYRERFAERPYDGEVAYVDAALGRVMRALESSGKLGDTVVAVTSDHGESLGEHGERTHGYTLYDASLAIPLLLRGPGVPAGVTATGVVSLVSLAPTLLALAGLPALPDADGEDLRARWAPDAPAVTGSAYAETLATQLDHGWSPLFAIRDDRSLYVRAPRAELYDLAEDPAQQRNLLDGDPEASATQVAAAETALVSVLGRERAVAATPLDATLRAQLDALGYMVSDAAAPDPTRGEAIIDPKDGLAFVAPFVRARSAYLAGEIASAAAQVRALQERLPDSARLHELAALVALAEGDPERAQGYADRAVARVPGSAAYRTLQGDLRLARGDIAGAEATFAAGLEHDPLDAGLQLRLAEIAEHQGRYDVALAGYLRAVELDPDAGAAEMGAAIQEVRLGLRDDVDDRLARAGAAAREPRLRNRLALARIARGEAAEAEILLRAVLVDHPRDPAARHNLATLLRKQGRAEEAARLLASPSSS